jgi:hypothetical protein
MFVLALLAAQAVHVAPPTPEGHIHQAAPGTLTVCPVAPVVPRGLEGWRTMTPVAAARAPVAIGVGQGVRATLLPQTEVTYSVAPAKPGARGTSGGVFAFEVARAGRHRVALAAGAWIDVVQGGRALPSKAHGHGPECSAIRKIVEFDLGPGRYLLQIAGSPFATLPLLIARAEG